MKIVPTHFNIDGHFCPRAGEATLTGHCGAGCDHAEHYSNDGHPECEDDQELHTFGLGSDSHGLCSCGERSDQRFGTTGAAREWHRHHRRNAKANA